MNYKVTVFIRGFEPEIIECYDIDAGPNTLLINLDDTDDTENVLVYPITDNIIKYKVERISNDKSN